MKFIPTACFFLFSLPIGEVLAQTGDDNIVIDNKTEVYSFQNPHNSTIILEERSKADYRCLKWPEMVSVAEFYDNNSEIRNASSIRAGKRITANYQMYQQDGVFYNDTKVCYFKIPFEKKGETATVSFEKICNDIHYINTILLFEPQYVRQKTAEIVIPAWMSVDIIEKNIGGNIEKNVTTDPKTGTVRYLYTVRDQEAVARPTDDAPGYFKTSPYLILVPKKASLKKEEVAFFNDYDDVYKWCRDKTDRVANDREEIGSFTDRIIGGCSADDEKIGVLFAWVQDNIRYLGFQYGLSGWVPDNAQDVLRKKYGDCKGMSNLLKTMLLHAGFDARLVWLGTNNVFADQTIPLPLFNHMICAVVREGSTLYLDPTVKYMVPGEYHEAIQGRMTMIEDGDRYILGRVPAVPVRQNTDSLHGTYRLDGATLVGHVSMTLSGESKQSILSQIYSLESSRRINALKHFLEKGQPQSKVSDISIEGADSRCNELKIKYVESRNGSVNRIGNELYIDLDTRQDFAGAAVDTTERKSDIEFPFRQYTLREEYFEIPDGYEIATLPSGLDIETDHYRIALSYRVVGNAIQYRKEIVIKDIWLKKQDFGRWNDDIDRLKNCYKEQLVLVTNP